MMPRAADACTWAGVTAYIRYDSGDGRPLEDEPGAWLFNTGWHFFLGPFEHDPIIVREATSGRWYLRWHDGKKMRGRVAGPFPSRRAATAAWRILQP